MAKRPHCGPPLPNARWRRIPEALDRREQASRPCRGDELTGSDDRNSLGSEAHAQVASQPAPPESPGAPVRRTFGIR